MKSLMGTSPPFPVTVEQAARLQGYVQTHRHYAFTMLLPSTDRNHTLRLLQTIQGKILEAMDKKTPVLQLPLTREEIRTLLSVVGELLLLYAKQPESAERITVLADLAALRQSLVVYGR